MSGLILTTSIVKVLLILDITSFCFANHVIDKCKEQCETLEDSSDSSWACDSSCRVQQCDNGCLLWQRGITTPCQDICAQHCIAGCNLAVDIYAQEVKDALTPMSRPDLVFGSQRNTSVILDWQHSIHGQYNISFRLQMRIPALKTEWEDHDNVQWLANSLRVKVNGLRPYTVYQFRIVAEIVNKRHFKTSNSSVNIRTKPHGVPEEAPTIVNIAAGSTYLHMKLMPPFYTNDQPVAYEVTVKEYFVTTAQLPTVIASYHSGFFKQSVLITGSYDTAVVTRLTPDTEYRVEVKLRNMNGVGPGVTTYVHTLAEKTVNSSKYMIYGADNTVLKHIVGDINPVPETIFQARQPGNNVTGVAFHLHEELIFVSVAIGAIYSVSKVSGDYVEKEIYFSNNQPSGLDVDWLNNRLYVAERNKILTCSLDGDCHIAVDNLDSQPEDIKVDPGSGYLFWVQSGRHSGIYRRDLTDLGESHSTSLRDDRIIELGLILAIAIDHANYRLFYANSDYNTIMSANFDGSDVTDIRLNVQSPALKVVSSLAFYDDLFVWSDGGSVLFESKANNKFYHNKVFSEETNFTGLNIWHSNSQPFPVPYLPPIKLQALFSYEVARLTWEPPTTGQGHGAWNTWFYEVEVINLSTGHNHTFGKLLQLNLSVTNVVPETPYSFRVRAFSTAGKGPWSLPFVGSTLPSGSSKGEVIVVDSENAVYNMTLSGDNQRLTDQYLGFEALKKFEIDGNHMLWSSEEGHLFHSKGISPVPDLNNIHIFAYDWIGNTLYWAPTKPQKNMIKRLSLEPVVDNYPETIVQDAMGFSVEDIVIDAVQGYIYFTTHISVEASRLDGRDYTTIHRENDYYSGKYVLGVALDYTTDSLYWLLKTTDNVKLYRAPLFTLWEPQTEASGMDIQDPEVLFSFKTQSLPRMLHFYSNKLFWKSDKKPELEILDIGSQSLSRIPLSLTGERVRAFLVNYPSRYKYPDSEDPGSIDVLPDEVHAPSIKRQGRWDNFDITWSPSSVGYGQVYYDVVLQDKDPIEMRAEEPHLSYIKDFKPYTLLTVVIKACTSWRCSKAKGTKFYTPMAVPSTPGQPRAYVTHHETLNSSNKKIKVEFHWNEPDPPNGIIEQYNIKISNRENGPFLDTKVKGQQNYYEVRNTKNNTVYYFMVQACTEAGCSSYTELISANATEPRPVPKLLTTSDTSANLFLPNEKRSQTVISDDICSLTYIAREDTYFWINNKGTIVKQDSQGEQELVNTNNTTGKSLTVDWVGRDLYWSAQTNRRANILKYDLNKQQGSVPVIVVSRVRVVWRLEISPYKRSLYWTETTSTQGHANLYTSDLKGNNPRSFFSDNRNQNNASEKRFRRQTCSCSGIEISPVFIIDHSEGTDAELYFVQAGTKNIWAAKLDGCQCRLVLNGTAVASNQSLDLPPDTMTIDQERLYWSTSDSSQLHSISKWTGDELNSVLQDTGSLKDIKAVGNHLQPMPDTKCLLIESYNKKPQLMHSTNTSIELRLKAWKPSTECATISAPTVKYLVHYKEVTEGPTPMPCDGMGVHCDTKESYDLDTGLTGLKPHTSYLVQVAATNYYMESRQRRAVYALHDIYTTSNGVPSAPRNFKAIAVIPTQVNITWRSPLSPNAPLDELVYKLEYHYFKQDSTKKHSQRTVQGMPTEGQGDGMSYSYTVTDLQNATKYYFKIMVTSAAQNGSTASPEVEVETFDYPATVHVINKTESSLSVGWVSPNNTSVVTHRIEYASKDMSGYWVWNSNTSEVHQTLSNTLYIQEFTALSAFTHYAFRVHVVFKSGEPFVWPEKVTKTFRTKATIPSIPGQPYISRQGHLTTLKWDEPDNGGVPILFYTIYATCLSDPKETKVYNSSDGRWIIEALAEEEKYVFAVAATNSQGTSETTTNSTVLTFVPLPEALKSNDSEKLTVILSTCFGVIFLLVVMVMFVLLWRRYKDPKAKQFGLVSSFRRPDMELATLREMPRVAMTSNALYAINIIPTDEGIAALPHYHREDLSLTKFLGSGAFGEVYEGIAHNILSSDSGETKVAVKALKKGATDNEKEEFLKEALLMSNFKHSHILSLLGVCLHNDPQFIILELMEGGDLLTYLRSSRPSRIKHGYLQLSDMVCMSVDIAQGCKYLEELHFVHRDLAARNCLVSNCGDPSQRIVKIGDFGLARDIYKNDYYRKEGEGLMPVRWMSPESLVDGVFTTNSDVWAFGVLMWEILTLGQQPYPARTNLDVLNFVRRGGRLDRPDNCPDDMYELMLTCWSYNPEMRPPFHTILENLETFKEKSLDPASDFYNKRPTSGSSLSVKIPTSEGSKQTDADKSKQKNLKSNNVKRSFSFDMKGRFGIHASSSKMTAHQAPSIQHQRPPSQEGSGYLEPLVPPTENKYLELLRETDSCAKCGRVGCDDRCHRGLLRHSSDCSQNLQKCLNEEGETAIGGKLCKKGGKGKGCKLKKCDNAKTHRSDTGGLNSSSGTGCQGNEGESGGEGGKTKTVNGTRYHNVNSQQEILWKLGTDEEKNPQYSIGNCVGNNSRYSINRNSSGSVPGFLIHPHNVKRCSVMSDDTSSLQSLSLPPDFDELAPNNRSSVDSNSPLLMWGPSTKDKGKSSNRNSGLYQNGQAAGVKKYTLEDMDYLRRVASPMYNLENSEESLV